MKNRDFSYTENSNVVKVTDSKCYLGYIQEKAALTAVNEPKETEETGKKGKKSIGTFWKVVIWLFIILVIAGITAAVFHNIKKGKEDRKAFEKENGQNL